nr:amino acid permease [Gammaproteobacteria bacterium]
GHKTGLFTIWSEWLNNVIGVPTTLSFIAATLAYVFLPHVDQHKFIIFSLMLALIWGCTLFNFLGVKASSRLNIVGAIFGSIIPGIIIIVLGILWFISGKPLQIEFTWHSILPSMHIKNIAFLIVVLYAYAGMQITAFHAPNVKHPKRDFPNAISLAAGIILALTLLATLAIAMVVPPGQLSLVSGVMAGFSDFFHMYHLAWALPILGLLIALNGISSLSAWLLAPARGLAVAAQQGYFPSWCGHESRRGIPTHTMLLQAVLATGLSLLFLFSASISTAFWILMVLTSQFTLVMYVLVFSAAIRLRYSEREVTRAFQLPGGNITLWVTCGLSIMVCLTGIGLSYFPPASLKIASIWHFETFIICGDFLYIILPFVILKVFPSQRV